MSDRPTIVCIGCEVAPAEISLPDPDGGEPIHLCMACMEEMWRGAMSDLSATPSPS